MLIIKHDNLKSIYMVLEQVVCGTSFLEKIRIKPMSWPFLKRNFFGGILKVSESFNRLIDSISTIISIIHPIHLPNKVIPFVIPSIFSVFFITS